MEFINFYRSYTVDRNDGNKIKEKSNADDWVFIDNSKIDQTFPNYYGLNNVTRSFCGAKNDVFSADDIDRYKSQDKKVRFWW